MKAKLATGLALILAIAGCSTGDAPATGNVRSVSRDAVAAAPMDPRDENRPLYEAHRAKPGDSLSIDSLEFSDITVNKGDDSYRVSFKITNKSTNKVIKPFSAVTRARDEYGNEITIDQTVAPNAGECQPGGATKVEIGVKPKLAAAKHAQLWIITEQGLGRPDVRWQLDFDL